MRRLGALVASTWLAGCAALTTVGAVTGGATGSYQLARQMTQDFSAAIVQACHQWDVQIAAAQERISLAAVSADRAAKVSIIKEYADAACDPKNPPPGDPLATAIWLGGLAGQVAALTASHG